ncbi:MAG: NYN domain-containing protein [Comamonadaceae bacterium]|nr:MAG: NYN domain-containing protein [Comamonadaceae bacterium]
MTQTLRVMLLIDADNVSSDVIEQAVQHAMTEHGAAHVRRAYCNAETAVKQQALFKRLSVRPMVNISAGKNSTDIALAVDAIDLVIAERPDVVVLVSSDSDFAPLVIRLREKGCRVCGIGQQGKTGDDTVGVYDSFVDLAHKGTRPASAPARKTSVAKPAAKAPRAKAAPAAPAAKKTGAAKAPARKAAARKVAAPPSSPPPPSEAAEFILNAVPALRTGREVALNDAAQALRAAGLLGKHGSSLKLFDKLTAEFAVMQQPDRIRWTGAPAA